MRISSGWSASWPDPLWNRPQGHAIFETMDTETRAAIAALGETMHAGFARMESRMDAGFARTDRFFELQQAQHLEWRDELRGEVGELRGDVGGLRGEVGGLRGEVRALTARVDALTERVGGLEHEVSQLRDFVTREIAEIRLDLRELTERPGQTAELRREVAELTVRVDRLERRQSD
jgi:predicted RNase H-like nuclease (RuvC/YqgF family)